MMVKEPRKCELQMADRSKDIWDLLLRKYSDGKMIG